jgi:His/Glu/Gln/Arg/opine family amino acid ABC transporter permease subunit
MRGDAMEMIPFAPLLLRALLTTIWLSWLALLLAALGGVALALLRTSRFMPLRIAALLFVETFRSIPILIVMFFCYFGVPVVLGIDVSTFAAATAALALQASAAMSEVVRAGILSVGKGQWEAAQSSGMSYLQVMRYIVGPQAGRVILPPSVGIYIATLKESALASIIGVIELTKTGLLIRESTGAGLSALSVVALLYFVMNYGISQVGGVLERRLSVGSVRPVAGAAG